jgi:hypothetical protein
MISVPSTANKVAVTQIAVSTHPDAVAVRGAASTPCCRCKVLGMAPPFGKDACGACKKFDRRVA